MRGAWLCCAAMLTKTLSILLVAVSLSFVAGCGGAGSSCLPAVAANNVTCPASVFVDATASDPVCLAAGGVAICRRANDALCHPRNGGSFPDGCLLKNQEQV